MNALKGVLLQSDLALCMHSCISPPTALHAQSFSAFLPDLAQCLFQDPLDCGHWILGALLQLKAPAAMPLMRVYVHVTACACL